MDKFRLLRADEIECRIGNKNKDKTAFTLLLYKDARVDMRILDETVGALNWQKHYSRDNANCIVSIWDEDKCSWIEKEDVGTESKTEAEKGLASDSFKRACFNWGIGRELYTAPVIWISGHDDTEKFSVKEIGYDEAGNIDLLTIIENRSKEVVFTTNKAKSTGHKKADKAPETSEPVKSLVVQEAEARAKILGYFNRHQMGASDIQRLCAHYKVKSITMLTLDMCNDYIKRVTENGGNIDE